MPSPRRTAPTPARYQNSSCGRARCITFSSGTPPEAAPQGPGVERDRRELPPGRHPVAGRVPERRPDRLAVEDSEVGAPGCVVRPAGVGGEQRLEGPPRGTSQRVTGSSSKAAAITRTTSRRSATVAGRTSSTRDARPRTDEPVRSADVCGATSSQRPAGPAPLGRLAASWSRAGGGSPRCRMLCAWSHPARCSRRSLRRASGPRPAGRPPTARPPRTSAPAGC